MKQAVTFHVGDLTFSDWNMFKDFVRNIDLLLEESDQGDIIDEPFKLSVDEMYFKPFKMDEKEFVFSLMGA